MRCGEVWDGGGGGRGTEPGAACQSPGIRERLSLRHYGAPGACCAASATHTGPTEDCGGRQAGEQAGRRARRCTGEAGHELGLGGEDQALEAPSDNR